MMFFSELLQVALGKLERLSFTPTAEDWENVYDESMRQAVTGILLHGVDNLPSDQRPQQTLLLQWIGVWQMIEQRNTVLDNRCVDLLSRLSKAGLRPTILKGQGIARYYPESLRRLRQPGDIDVFVSDGREKAMEYAKSIGQKRIDWDYKHLHLHIWDDTEIELHYHVEVLMNPCKNKKLQRWFKDNEDLLYSEREGLIMPTIEMNLFYVLLHIYRHFFTEGVGLRQLMDYYYVLSAARGIVPHYAYGMSLDDVLNHFGMWKFAKGIMWIMHELFALESSCMYVEPSEEDGRFILEQVMEGGNFGHNKRMEIKGLGKLNTLFSVTRHNLRLMRRYPSEALSSPFWFLWHKLWKLAK